MSKLKEMQDSCAVFAADLKTGTLTWEDHTNGSKQNCDFLINVLGYKIKLYLTWCEIGDIEGKFVCIFSNAEEVILKSTTAKEAAAEALQLVKAEAQKLVDALSIEIEIPDMEAIFRKAEKEVYDKSVLDLYIEPKETDSQENNSWFYVRKTLGQVKDSLQAFTKKPQHLTDSVAANHFRDLEKAIIEVDKMGVELQKHNALSEPKETIKFDGLDEYFNPKADIYSKEFLEWRGKYFYPKKQVKEWKSKQNNTSYSNKELEDRYKNAFLDSPFNAKQ